MTRTQAIVVMGVCFGAACGALGLGVGLKIGSDQHGSGCYTVKGGKGVKGGGDGGDAIICGGGFAIGGGGGGGLDPAFGIPSPGGGR